MTEYSKDDIERIQESAVVKAKVENLEIVVHETNSSIKTICAAIEKMPGHMADCEHKINKEIMGHIKKHYITEHDLVDFERKVSADVIKETKILSIKIDSVSGEVAESNQRINDVKTQTSKQTWIFTGAVFTASAMYYLFVHTNFKFI